MDRENGEGGLCIHIQRLVQYSITIIMRVVLTTYYYEYTLQARAQKLTMMRP